MPGMRVSKAGYAQELVNAKTNNTAPPGAARPRSLADNEIYATET